MNSSGVYPKGNRVVVLPDVIEEKTAGGILLPAKDLERHQMAQATGTLVAVGDDAWWDGKEMTERMIDGQWRPVERRQWGCSVPFAKIGERVCFAKYNGMQFDGDDGKQYRLLNDQDITGTISEKMDFTEMRTREPMSQARSQG